MFKPVAGFGGFSVDDIDAAKAFYTQKLGLEAKDMMGGVQVVLPNGNAVWIYAKPNHEAATYTTLNFVVEDIDSAVDTLSKNGVRFERYEGMHQDDKGIARGLEQDMGPNIAWFKDPAGNILAVLQDK
jgi:catechol 2,3-dioxygenase-like lactoylglutathione lyase family enzyme